MMKKVLALALCVCMAAMLLAAAAARAALPPPLPLPAAPLRHQRLRRGRAGPKHQSDAHLCHLRQRGHGPV